MLFNILCQSTELFSLYRESWNVIRGAYKRKMLDANAKDDVITSEELDDELKQYLLAEFHKYTVNDKAQSFLINDHIKIPGLASRLPIPNLMAPVFKAFNGTSKDMRFDHYRIIEKTPRNCFRVDFMDKLFPDAKFIYISRDGKSNVSSLIEGWRKNAKLPNHQRYPKINIDFKMSNFEYKKWEYVLPPGWQDFNGKSLEEVCAHQWIQSNKYALEGLDKIHSSRVHKIRYEDLTKDPATIIQGITDFINVEYTGKLKEFAEQPPVVSTSFREKPSADKWKKNQEAIERVAPMLEEMMNKLGYKIESFA